ncbi:MAG TPA: hypothetical protein VIP57_13495 [Candidatus Dormibacteraeota bacterium]
MPSIRGSHRGSELNGLGSPDEITLFIRQQEALLVRAQRKEADARVRHSNFELIQRVVLLVLAIAVGVAVVIGAAGNPELLKLALGGGGLLGAIGAALHRWDHKQRGDRD